jgi:rare lipoprotein A
MNPTMHSLIAATLAMTFAGGAALAEDRKPDHAKSFSGIASFYSKDYHGKTARGDVYDAAKFTAAHRTLPFGTRLRVTGPGNRSVVVEVNDRGPFIKTRVLDLSFAAAKELRIISRGLARVTAQVEQAGLTTVSDRSTR